MKHDSKLSKLSPEQLLYVCGKLTKIKPISDWLDPFNDANEYKRDLHEIVKYFGIREINSFDLEFMSKFISTNLSVIQDFLNTKDLEKLELIVYPEQTNYTVFYEVWGPATFTEKYSVSWPSYDKDWVSKSIKESYYDAEFYYYDGNYQDYEVDNFETQNFEVIDYIAENKKKSNNKPLLETLDKKTLLKLRKVIDERLELL